MRKSFPTIFFIIAPLLSFVIAVSACYGNGTYPVPSGEASAVPTGADSTNAPAPSVPSYMDDEVDAQIRAELEKRLKGLQSGVYSAIVDGRERRLLIDAETHQFRFDFKYNSGINDRSYTWYFWTDEQASTIDCYGYIFKLNDEGELVFDGNATARQLNESDPNMPHLEDGTIFRFEPDGKAERMPLSELRSGEYYATIANARRRLKLNAVTRKFTFNFGGMFPLRFYGGHCSVDEQARTIECYGYVFWLNADGDLVFDGAATIGQQCEVDDSVPYFEDGTIFRFEPSDKLF